MTDLSTMQKLGLAPLTSEQKEGRIQMKIDQLIESYNLPRWAYLAIEFEVFCNKMITLVKELRSEQRRGA